VFARDEEGAIADCLHNISRAKIDKDMHVTVILNGTKDNSLEVACLTMRELRSQGAIYHIPFADKSNAWNQFVYGLRPSASTYFFIDAYAMVNRNSFAALAAKLDCDRSAHAAAAIPSTGRSAARIRKTMQSHGGLHGSLFALRGDFVERLVSLEIRLPVGLYRGDGLIGSLAMHDVDPLRNGWCTSRVPLVTGATWRVRQLQPWRRNDLVRYGRRLINQARGRLEHSAIKDIIYQAGFQALPEFADQMILDWIAVDPKRREPAVYRDPFAALAFRQIIGRRPPPSSALQPRLAWVC